MCSYLVNQDSSDKNPTDMWLLELLDCIASPRQTSFHGANPTGPVLLILGDVLLRPLLMCILFLPNLVVAAHHTEQSSSGRAYRSSFSCISRDSAANRADAASPDPHTGT
jgi:hypothetical protein